VAVGLLAAAALTGCSPGSGDARLTAAPRASDAACPAALAGLPDTVLGHGRTPLDIAGAAAWGEPAITLRCGLPEPAPSSDRCLTVADVDWVVDDAGDPIVFVSYGRSPAAEIRVPTSYGRDSAAAALVDLAAVAKALPQTTHRCVGG
jgi:Protein of unknown function (DUF3515)